MKCEYCSANITIDNEKCPYCNAPNPFYEAHRKDMKEYKKRYESTTKEVVDKTNRFTKKTVSITIISVLAALNIIAILVLVNMWNITYAISNNYNKKHANEYALLAAGYEESGDYLKLYALMSSKYAYYNGSPLAEYSLVQTASGNYSSIVQTFGYVLTDSYYGDEGTFAQKINSNLESLYKIDTEFKDAKIKTGRYAVNHENAVEDMINESNILISAYLGLDIEKVNGLRELSTSKRQLIIEEAVKEVYFDEH